jgi:hypothetical protein
MIILICILLIFYVIFSYIFICEFTEGEIDEKVYLFSPILFPVFFIIILAEKWANKLK